MRYIFDLLRSHAVQIWERLKNSETKRINNISICYLALLLSFHEKPFIVIEDSDESALKFYNDFMFFNSAIKNKQSSVIYFPPPFNQDNIGERAKAIYKIKKTVDRRHKTVDGRWSAVSSQEKTVDGGQGTGDRRKNLFSMITSKEAYQTGFSTSEIQSNILILKKGMEIGRERLQTWLSSNGYRRVSVVIEKGEYSQRGWLFDIYPVTEDFPVRVEFFGDDVDLIRMFEVETQRSVKEVDEIMVFAAKEPEIKTDLLVEFLKNDDRDIFINSDIKDSIELHPSVSFVSFSHLPFVQEGIDSEEMSIAGLGILHSERRDIRDISEALKKLTKPVLIIMSSRAQAERFKEVMADEGIIMPIIDRNELSSYEGLFCITVGNLSAGINLPEILILTDREIFGERPTFRPIKKSKISHLLKSIEDLSIGDFVVHGDHGIGRFAGLERKKTDDTEQDLVTIDYANGTIYVPFHNINKIQKYSAAEGAIPHLDSLGSKAWQKTKQKVQKGVKEMAEKLLKLYAERRIVRGFKFTDDTLMHKEFDDFFPYEETEDQVKALNEIKRLMSSETPMDMLLCGDVGYGKTEIAIRAAFRAVYDGKQVAVLVPTTLLAEQHFRTFNSRFSGFPVRIDYLSRLKSPKEIKKTVDSIIRGEVDIVIGTHMLLNKNIHFRDLGLLIIDEEHRFGVVQKERLKELKKGVDVLTLTATPIPRTLQMSLSGIRQMCTIDTPPEERLSVKSIITVFDEKIIKDAIDRELNRGGQVFFVHNRILDIEKIADFVKKIVPYGKIAVAHGRMRERDLEGIMIRFLNKEIDILVCTAIIGSGLDITNANTIIINRADTFGLSDLYQLKGRVGRGNIQAYAYFLIPGEDIITDDAKKRLKAIHEMSYLGAGLRIALKDLEIRGAGNLLGPEQSGHIYKVGFDMYMEMFEKAVAELKGEEIVEKVDPQIKLKTSAYIPEYYIEDITVRLGFYRRFSSLNTNDELDDLRDELIDRFGKLPEEVENLIHVIRIKMLASHIYIQKIFELDNRYRFYFISDSDEKYKIEGGYFDKLLYVLFEIQKKEKKIRFLSDGFELLKNERNKRRSLLEVEQILNDIWTMIKK
jgi:transcription-repair coupling factor (superfamily II helicase)